MKLFTLLLPTLLICCRLSAQIPIPNVQFTYQQNFGGLATSGTNNIWNNKATVVGWYATPNTYRADDGNDGVVALYSFGAAQGNTSDRALGSIADAGTTVAYGLRLVNQSQFTVYSMALTFDGEQWRQGSLTPDTLHFSYRIDNEVTSLTTGTWTDVDALDFVSPVVTGSTNVAMNGNSGGNRVRLSATLTFTLEPNQEIMLRWLDIDAPGTDDGLAIERIRIANLSLPIELVRLEVEASGEAASLSWTTATETNNAFFEVEHSADGLSFSGIGQVAGAGTTFEQQEYRFTDPHPLPGKNYYRLRQVDADGAYSFSPIVSVMIEKAGGVRIYPSLATDQLQVVLESPDATAWQVFDAAGQPVAEGQWPEETRRGDIAVGQLPAGAYVLRIHVGTSTVTKKFWKR